MDSAYASMSVDHVADGRLVRVLADRSALMTGYHRYYPNRQPSPAFTLLVETPPYRKPPPDLPPPPRRA